MNICLNITSCSAKKNEPGRQLIAPSFFDTRCLPFWKVPNQSRSPCSLSPLFVPSLREASPSNLLRENQKLLLASPTLHWLLRSSKLSVHLLEKSQTHRIQSFRHEKCRICQIFFWVRSQNMRPSQFRPDTPSIKSTLICLRCLRHLRPSCTSRVQL